MGDNRHIKPELADEIEQLFTFTTEMIVEYLGRDAFRPRRTLIAAVFDAVMIGIAKRLEETLIEDEEALFASYVTLLKNKEFINATTDHTTDEVNVKKRIELAINAFSVNK